MSGLLANRSKFPQEIDTFVELYDLPPSKVSQAKRFQELKQKPSLNANEQTELNSLVVDLGNYIISPETWNKFADALVNVESFFTQEVMGFIEAKQALWDTYVKNFKYVGKYSESQQYKYQNQVTFNGDLYLCTKDSQGISPENDENWQKISSKGDKGDIGLNLFYQGEFDESKEYKVGDAITYQGVVYFAKEIVSGIPPTDADKWSIYDRTFVGKDKPVNAQQGLIWIEVLE